MLKHPVRKIITDAIWSKLEVALSAAKHSAAGAPGEMTDREFLEAVLHLLRTGCPWRDLPPALGYWHAVYMRFRRWEARGVWPRLWKNLQAEPFAGARGVLLDSTTVRAHPHAAGAPKKTAATRLWAALAGAGAPNSTPPRSTKTARSRST
jgi:transposase